MNIKTQVEEMFEDRCSNRDIDALVLTSRNGVPIASYIDKNEKTESFSALSATILGASEVIFSGFGKGDPELIEISSDDTLLLVKGVDKSSVISALANGGDISELNGLMDELIDNIRQLKNVEE
ncbi:MAG: roadblock/LC7 domain-containing protein [Thermoplasmata archaeon]